MLTKSCVYTFNSNKEICDSNIKYVLIADFIIVDENVYIDYIFEDIVNNVFEVRNVEKIFNGDYFNDFLSLEIIKFSEEKGVNLCSYL